MKQLLLSAIWVLSIHNIYGQDKTAAEFLPDLEWGQGSLLLNDGTEKSGLLRFNDREGGIVSYENGSERHSFNARSILGFEFFDERIQRQRVFYTLDFDEGHGQGKRPVFFEVLKDLKTFAMISKVDPIRIKQQQSAMASTPGGGTVVTKIRQTETVYILTPEGEIKPYLKLTRKVVDRVLLDKNKMKDKVLDADLLEKYFLEPGYSSMITYAEERKLDLEDKEDLIKILEHYSLVMNKD